MNDDKIHLKICSNGLKVFCVFLLLRSMINKKFSYRVRIGPAGLEPPAALGKKHSSPFFEKGKGLTKGQNIYRIHAH